MNKAEELLHVIQNKLLNLHVAVLEDKKALAKLQFAMLEYDLNKLKDLVFGENHPSK